jgi:hypothetical protein
MQSSNPDIVARTFALLTIYAEDLHEAATDGQAPHLELERIYDLLVRIRVDLERAETLRSALVAINGAPQ